MIFSTAISSSSSFSLAISYYISVFGVYYSPCKEWLYVFVSLSHITVTHLDQLTSQFDKWSKSTQRKKNERKQTHSQKMPA